MLAAMEARPEPGDRVVPALEVRKRIQEEVGRLEWALESGAPLEAGPGNRRRVLPVGQVEIGRELRFLRQIARALQETQAEEVAYDRAGLGSVLFVQDTGSGHERVYRLMAEPLHPLDVSQVSLGSPVGRAFQGSRPGSAVWVDGPFRRQRLRVLTLKTLPRRLGMEPSLPSATGRF